MKITITTPLYPLAVKVSESRRPKYRHRNDPNLPERFHGKPTDEYGYLLDQDGNRMLANPKVAGTPKYEKLAGNSFMSGFSSPHTRSKIVAMLREFFQPFVRQAVSDNPKLPFRGKRIRIQWQVWCPEGKGDWDLSNLSFYFKYFEDSLHDDQLPLLEDDNIRHVSAIEGPIWYPTETPEERKFVFILEEDPRFTQTS